MGIYYVTNPSLSVCLCLSSPKSDITLYIIEEINLDLIEF